MALTPRIAVGGLLGLVQQNIANALDTVLGGSANLVARSLTVTPNGVSVTGGTTSDTYSGGSTSAGTPSFKGVTLGTTGLSSSGPVNAGSQLVTGNLQNSTGFKMPLLSLTQQGNTIPINTNADFPSTQNTQIYVPYSGSIVAISARWVTARNTAGTLTFYTHWFTGGVDHLDSGQSVTLDNTIDAAMLILPTPRAFTAGGTSGNALAIRVVSNGTYAAPANCYVTATLWAIV